MSWLGNTAISSQIFFEDLTSTPVSSKAAPSTLDETKSGKMVMQFYSNAWVAWLDDPVNGWVELSQVTAP